MSLMQQAVDVMDWEDLNYSVVDPQPTIEDAKEYGFSSIEEFNETLEYYEWSEKFDPMMNYYWPVKEPEDFQEAANEMYKQGLNTALIYLEEEDQYAIVLTGGGMDLSWDIAAAYVCCGDVPPASLLRVLSSHCTVNDEMRSKVVVAAHDAAERLIVFAERLKEIR